MIFPARRTKHIPYSVDFVAVLVCTLRVFPLLTTVWFSLLRNRDALESCLVMSSSLMVSTLRSVLVSSSGIRGLTGLPPLCTSSVLVVRAVAVWIVKELWCMLVSLPNGSSRYSTVSSPLLLGAGPFTLRSASSSISKTGTKFLVLRSRKTAWVSCALTPSNSSLRTSSSRWTTTLTCQSSGSTIWESSIGKLLGDTLYLSLPGNFERLYQRVSPFNSCLNLWLKILRSAPWTRPWKSSSKSSSSLSFVASVQPSPSATKLWHCPTSPQTLLRRAFFRGTDLSRSPITRTRPGTIGLT
mmetsp:Transcript_11315/g.19986  ORF Transcript_11315/g.19986 Transcript_11315/m.19986 type:complete len:298 (+) Transcript_11315:62-955(+)